MMVRIFELDQSAMEPPIHLFHPFYQLSAESTSETSGSHDHTISVFQRQEPATAVSLESWKESICSLMIHAEDKSEILRSLRKIGDVHHDPYTVSLNLLVSLLIHNSAYSTVLRLFFYLNTIFFT